MMQATLCIKIVSNLPNGCIIDSEIMNINISEQCSSKLHVENSLQGGAIQDL